MRRVILPIYASEQVTINTPGEFIRYHRGTVPLRVQSEQGNLFIELEAGQSFRSDSDFTALQVSNIGNAADIVELIVGAGDFNDARISGIVGVEGIVDVRSIIEGKTAFGAGASIAPAAGQFASVLLENPSGSGKTLFVYKSQLIPIVNSTDVFFTRVPAFAHTGELIPSINKTDNGIPALGKFYRESENFRHADVVGIGTLTRYYFPNVGDLYIYDSADNPIVVKPGNILVMESGNVDKAFAASFEWYEE